MLHWPIGRHLPDPVLCLLLGPQAALPVVDAVLQREGAARVLDHLPQPARTGARLLVVREDVEGRREASSPDIDGQRHQNSNSARFIRSTHNMRTAVLYSLSATIYRPFFHIVCPAARGPFVDGSLSFYTPGLSSFTARRRRKR